MKKREVYEGWRFNCRGDKLFTKDNGFFKPLDDFGWFDEKQKNNLEKYRVCPCGKGCKPIRCKIIVENDI